MPFHSASLIPKRGNKFIFVKEKRLDKNINHERVQVHMFGGKIENESAKECAIREFNEEYFNSDTNWAKTMKRRIYEYLSNMEMDVFIYTVNEEKKLQHVFFTFDIDKISDKGLRNFFQKMDMYFRPSKKFLRLHTHIIGSEISKTSSLLKVYLGNFSDGIY